MAKQLLCRGFKLIPLIEAIDLDAPMPTIENINVGELQIAPDDLVRWAGEQWPADWEAYKAQYAEAMAAETNAEVDAKRAARKTSPRAKKAAPRKAAAKKATP